MRHRRSFASNCGTQIASRLYESPHDVPRSRFFVILLLTSMAISLMSACARPEAPRQPDRYYQFDMDLEINEKPVHVLYNWHCTQVVRHAGEGWPFPTHIFDKKLAYWFWLDSRAGTPVVAELDDSALVAAFPLVGKGCDDIDGETPYNGDIAVIKTNPDNDVVGVMFTNARSQSRDYGINIRTAVVRRLPGKASDSLPSRDLIQRANQMPFAYERVIARVIPADEVTWWETPIADHFRDAHGVVVAASRPEHNNLFDVRQKTSVVFDAEAYSTPVAKLDNVWKVSLKDESHQAFPYYAIATALSPQQKENVWIPCPEATVDYAGHLIAVSGSQELYDADRRLLIHIVAQCDATLLNPTLWK